MIKLAEHWTWNRLNSIWRRVSSMKSIKFLASGHKQQTDYHNTSWASSSSFLVCDQVLEGRTYRSASSLGRSVTLFTFCPQVGGNNMPTAGPSCLHTCLFCLDSSLFHTVLRWAINRESVCGCPSHSKCGPQSNATVWSICYNSKK